MQKNINPPKPQQGLWKIGAGVAAGSAAAAGLAASSGLIRTTVGSLVQAAQNQLSPETIPLNQFVARDYINLQVYGQVIAGYDPNGHLVQASMIGSEQYPDFFSQHAVAHDTWGQLSTRVAGWGAVLFGLVSTVTMLTKVYRDKVRPWMLLRRLEHQIFTLADAESKRRGGANSLDSVYGHDHTITQLRAIALQWSQEGYWIDQGVRPPRVLILNGPPGTGKTSIASALSCELNRQANVLVVPIPQDALENIDLGYTSVVSIIEQIMKASASRHKGKTVVFLFDELDKRYYNHNLLELLKRLADEPNGTENCKFIATTNSLAKVTEPMKRSGRGMRIFEIPRPKGIARLKILVSVLRQNKRVRLPDDLSGLATNLTGTYSKAVLDLVRLSEGFSGADAAEWAQIAIQEAIIMAEKRPGHSEGTVLITTAILEHAKSELSNRGKPLDEGDWDVDSKDETNAAQGISKKRSASDDIQIAYHEAGHAIMGLVFGKTFEDVTIQASAAGSEGQTKFPLKSDLNVKDAVADIFIGLGGLMGEMAGIGKYGLGGGGDLPAVRKLIDHLIASGHGPLGLVDTDTCHLDQTTIAWKQDIVRRSQAVTLVVLKLLRDPHNRLKDKLVRDRTVRGSDANEVIGEIHLPFQVQSLVQYALTGELAEDLREYIAPSQGKV